MKDKFDKFFSRWNGKPCEVSDPSNPDQCMDLAYAWLDELGVPRDTIRHLYASQVWTKPTDITLQYFELRPNTPGGVPPMGSLVVFNIGTAGHISVGTGKGDANSFISFDQNYGSNKLPHEITHNYTNVFGWLILREPEMSDDETKALKLLEDYRVSNGLGNDESAVRDLVGKSIDLVKIQTELLEYKDGEKTRIDNAISSAITQNNKDWQSKIDTANTTIQTLNNRIDVLVTNQAENLSYKDLFSIAFRKFWKIKKGSE